MIRLVWIVILMWILSEALLPWEAYAAEVPQTNVVLILIDDFGWRDLGCYGSTYYQTPNIDRLAEQGMRFTNGYMPLDATALKKFSESKTRLAVADLLRELGGESKQSVNK